MPGLAAANAPAEPAPHARPPPEATVLFVLGLGERIGDLADARTDEVGRALEAERLPKRVRLPRKRTSEGGP